MSYFEQMDYFEQQQQLIKSPIKYREKETVYLFSKSDKEYTFKNGVCDEWEQEFEFLKILMRKLKIFPVDRRKGPRFVKFYCKSQIF